MLFEDLGDALADHVASARSEVLLVAPFVKVGALDKVLAGLWPEVVLTLVTRWRLDEIAAGVSDVDAYDSIVTRGGTVRLLDHLHAKYYRADDLVLTGSANLTATALGWTPRSNLEVLRAQSISGESNSFERLLALHSVPVDEAFAARFLELQAQLRRDMPLPILEASRDESTGDTDLFELLPRDPSDIWLSYVAPGSIDLNRGQAERLGKLLIALGLPGGIQTETVFRAAVGQALWMRPEIQKLYSWVGDGRRFGEVSAMIQSTRACTSDEADYVAQQVLRNVVWFIPEEFALRRPRHTEVLVRAR